MVNNGMKQEKKEMRSYAITYRIPEKIQMHKTTQQILKIADIIKYKLISVILGNEILLHFECIVISYGVIFSDSYVNFMVQFYFSKQILVKEACNS